MTKKIFAIVGILSIGIILLYSFAGCWNYRGLDEIDIVTGVAVDYNDTSNGEGRYCFTYEMIDTTNSSKEKSEQTKYIVAYGNTLLEGVRSAKKRLIKRIYMGNLQTIIISKAVASQDGIDSIVQTLLRDEEPRETMSLVISYEETAAKIFDAESTDTPIISYELKKTVDEDLKVTGSSVDVALYQAYQCLHGEGKTLLLPVFRLVDNQDQTVAELYGSAVFEKDKLSGFLSPLESKYLLFLKGQIKGGVLNVKFGDEAPYMASFEIKKADISRKPKLDNGQLTYNCNIKLELNLVEISPDKEVTPNKEILQDLVAEVLTQRLEETYSTAKNKFGQDIFSIGNLVYKNSRTKWQSNKDNWSEIFVNSAAKIKCTVDIPFSGTLKR